MIKPVEIQEVNRRLVDLTMQNLIDANPDVGFIVIMVEEKDVTVSGNIPQGEIRGLLQQAIDNLFGKSGGDA